MTFQVTWGKQAREEFKAVVPVGMMCCEKHLRPNHIHIYIRPTYIHLDAVIWAAIYCQGLVKYAMWEACHNYSLLQSSGYDTEMLVDALCLAGLSRSSRLRDFWTLLLHLSVCQTWTFSCTEQQCTILITTKCNPPVHTTNSLQFRDPKSPGSSRSLLYLHGGAQMPLSNIKWPVSHANFISEWEKFCQNKWQKQHERVKVRQVGRERVSISHPHCIAL